MEKNSVINRLPRLSAVHSMKDIPSAAHALSPGAHCPLFGSMLVIQRIQDSVMLVVGPTECCFYLKKKGSQYADFGGAVGRCAVLTLDAHDIAFGFHDKLTQTVDTVVKEYLPRAVFIVTTCSVEIIGEDVDSIAQAASERHGLPILPLHTEHFTCDSHMPGMERAMAVCADMMQVQPRGKKVNLLGYRAGIYENTELYAFLAKAGIGTALRLPGKCTTKEIIQAPGASLNIVVNSFALPLAREMERRFGTPYVDFRKHLSPQYVLEQYELLFRLLELPLPEEIRKSAQDAGDQIRMLRPKLERISYLYGNTPFQGMEFNAFLVSLGMRPLVLQISDWEDAERYIPQILKAADPYVTHSADTIPVQLLYRELHPQICFGHEFLPTQYHSGMAMVKSSGCGKLLGFEACVSMIQEILSAVSRIDAKGGADSYGI